MKRIDLIIDALEMAANKCESAYVAIHIDEALAAAKELKELKPVAWRVGGINFYTQDVAKAQSHTKKQQLFSLYALEVTK